jgi:hypothetical protein
MTNAPRARGVSLSYALVDIEHGAGSQFDPAVVEAFLALQPADSLAVPGRSLRASGASHRRIRIRIGLEIATTRPWRSARTFTR